MALYYCILREINSGLHLGLQKSVSVLVSGTGNRLVRLK